MSLDLSPRTALAVLLATLLIVGGGWVAAAESADTGGQDRAAEEYVELEDGTLLWPYHSETLDHSTRTLPINVVVYGDAEAVETMFLYGPGQWEEIPAEQQDVDPDEASATAEGPLVDWAPAEGAVRYIALEEPGEGIHYWKPADYHLHDGDYLGSRTHIRAYADPADGEWTAMQAHREHWDWFRLRHTVHSVEDAQNHVEQRFQDRWYVADLSREHFDNSKGSDSNGWVSVVKLEQWLLAGTLLAGMTATTHRGIDLASERWETIGRAALLAGAVAAPYLFVRFGAIAVHRAVPGIDPWLVVGCFLPLLVVGQPAATYLAARGLEAIPAFAVASLAFLVTLLLDYTILGVSSLPLDTVVHHVAVVAAIGFVAAGASRRARRPRTELGHVRTGVLLWIVAGVLPLLRFVYPV